MPGGWADLGNAPASVAEREVWEESGYRVKAEKVVAVLDANRIEPMEFYHAYKIIFLCKLLDGEPRTSHETLAVDFFDPNELPPLSLFRTNEAMLQEVFAHVAGSTPPDAVRLIYTRCNPHRRVPLPGIFETAVRAKNV